MPIACHSSDEFGDLTYVINGVDYTIPNVEWTFEAEPAGKNYKEKNPHNVAAQISESTAKPEKPMQCRGAIRPRDVKNQMFVAGNIFMRNFYTVFDRDNDRVGIAQRAPNFNQ